MMPSERQPFAYSPTACGMLAFGALCLLVTAPAEAQGIGPPVGLREAFLAIWGFCGIVAGVLLGVAFALEKKRRRSFVTIALTLMAFLYSLTAIACFFLESKGGASKFTGTIGFVVLSFVASYFLHKRKRLALGSFALIGLALATLLLIPNTYWERPLLSLTRIVYEDNIVGDRALVLRTPYGYGGRLALDDGRLLIQTQYIPERPRYRGQPETTPYSNGIAVVLEPVTSARPGNWYEIQHYDRTYVSDAWPDGQRARYVLGIFEERVETYRPSNRTLGYLVDESAGQSYEDIIIDLLREQYGSWGNEPDRHDPGNKYHWAQTLVERGDVDLQSPQFLDRAFRDGVQTSGLIGLWSLGISPLAQDLRGNTIQHFAAASCDARLLYFLDDKGVDPNIRNGNGQTAPEIVRARTSRDPRGCAAAQRYFDARPATPAIEAQ